MLVRDLIGTEAHEEEVSTQNIVIAGLDFKMMIKPEDFDLVNSHRQAFQNAGVFLNQINIMAISVPFGPLSWPFKKIQPFPKRTIIEMTENPIATITSAEKALFYSKDEVFDIAVIIEKDSRSGQNLTIGALILKKTNYINTTKRFSEGIVCSILNSAGGDIVEKVVAKANEKLLDEWVMQGNHGKIMPSERCITFQSIMIIPQGFSPVATTKYFFDAINRTSFGQGCLIMLIWPEANGTESAILIQT